MKLQQDTPQNISVSVLALFAVVLMCMALALFGCKDEGGPVIATGQAMPAATSIADSWTTATPAPTPRPFAWVYSNQVVIDPYPEDK